MVSTRGKQITYLIILLFSNCYSGISPNWLLFCCFLQKTLSSLELLGVVPVVAPSNAAIAVSPTSESQEKVAECACDTNCGSEFIERPKYKVNDPARDFSIQLLEKFSLVTKFARETTSQLFRENSGENLFLSDCRKPNHIPALPAAPPKLPPNDVQKVSDEVHVPEDPLEVSLSLMRVLVIFWEKFIHLLFSLQ